MIVAEGRRIVGRAWARGTYWPRRRLVLVNLIHAAKFASRRGSGSVALKLPSAAQRRCVLCDHGESQHGTDTPPDRSNPVGGDEAPVRRLVPAATEGVVGRYRERDGGGVHEDENTESDDDQRSADALGGRYNERNRTEQFEPHAHADDPRDAARVFIVEGGEPPPIGVDEKRVVDELDGPDHAGHEDRRRDVR